MAGRCASAPASTILEGFRTRLRQFLCQTGRLPAFQKKGQHDSFRYPDPKQFKIDAGNNRVFLPNCGWIRYRKSQEILGTAKNVTVSYVASKWYASIQTEREMEQPVHPASSIVGIDVGIARFATLSDGTVFDPGNSFKKQQARLARYQRAMSRKVKFSSNWKKEKTRITKLHSKIGNIRRDYLHKTTTAISKNHDHGNL